jgi:hypothetical protein
MGAPQYVPKKPAANVRSYASPPRRAESWLADRPGELTGRQPEGDRLGVPGPDPGYAISLTERFRDSLQLHEGEAESDVLAGAGAIAMKRAGLLGRAPISADVEIGLTVWGYLDANVDEELVSLRRQWFEEIHTRHFYMDRRRVADAVPDELLLQSPAGIKAAYAADWRACLDLTV